MATLTDEEKVKQFTGGVDDKSDETSKEPEKPEKESQEDDGQTELKSEEIEKLDSETESSEEEKTSDKPFPWLKGDNPDEWNKELAQAYENSTNEALRLKKQADDSASLLDEAKRVIANANPEEPAPLLDLDNHPDIRYIRTQRNNDMVKAFDDFKVVYPQATEPEPFAKFEKAVPGVTQAFVDSEGREPTFTELFTRIAGALGWQPTQDTAAKDAAIKESGASSSVTSSRQPVKTASFTEAQLAAARRMFPNQTDEEIIKDLQQYVT